MGERCVVNNGGTGRRISKTGSVLLEYERVSSKGEKSLSETHPKNFTCTEGSQLGFLIRGKGRVKKRLKGRFSESLRWDEKDLSGDPEKTNSYLRRKKEKI